jgi:hypothetical protein
VKSRSIPVFLSSLTLCAVSLLSAQDVSATKTTSININPLVADFKWTSGEPDHAKTIVTLTKIIGGIDAELSIGFAF